jgi:hypothetical protein
MSLRYPALATALALAVTLPAAATIESHSHLLLDLTRPEAAKAKARWSDPDKVTVTPDGLGWGTTADPGHRDVWLETTEPLALGLSWRPTIAASLRVTVRNPGDNGQLYACFSSDGKHWTTWQPLEPAPMPPGVAGTPKEPSQTFRGTLRVPYKARERYSQLLHDYSRRDDVPWASDEEALVKDLVKRDPAFFERQTPFIGFVRLLYECQMPGGRPLRGLEVEASWGVGGAQAAPKDPAAARGRSGPWRFRAD